MDMAHIFILNLKKWRRNMGLSQKVLAERCNAAHSYIRQLESGSGHPSFAFIEKLADALNIEPYMLFYDEAAAESEKAIKPDSVEKVRNDFLEKVGHELDNVIDNVKAIPKKAKEK